MLKSLSSFLQYDEAAQMDDSLHKDQDQKKSLTLVIKTLFELFGQ